MANIMSGREHHWKTDGRDVVVRIEEANGKGVLHLDGGSVPFVARDRDSDGGWIEINGQSHQYFVHRNREKTAVWIGGRTYRFERIEKGRAVEQAAGSASGEIRALMPGKVLRIDVAVGDTVASGQSVLIMESMKMESALTAPRSGKVIAVRGEVGQIVEMGELLVVVE